MKKKWIQDAIHFGVKTKTWKIMRLCVLFLFLMISQVWAGSGYSQQTKLTLKMDNAKVLDVLDEIENNSEFYFLFNQKLVDVERKVDVNVKESSVEKVLNDLFSETDVKHQVKDRMIILTTSKSGFGDNLVSLQQNSVTGKVTDENEEPLPGVTVLIKGTTSGTVTNVDGNYTLTNVPDNTTLQFSFIGMKTQEVVVGDQTTIDVIMALDAIGLEEVVAVGYGTARRKDISGAVSTVRLEDSPVSNSPNTSALQALKGSVAGLNIGESNSAGQTPSISIRGQNSIGGDNDPLVVLDGIIYLGSMSDINPDDIAVMDVLKDASAAAVYGSRASNGVIVITTKKGRSDKPVITFNTSVGVSSWQKKFDMMNTDRWNEKYAAQNELSSVDDIVQNDTYAQLLYEQGDIDTDWFDLATRNGVTQNHQVSVSGRSNKINYYFSGGYTNQQGVVIGDDYERISVRTKLDADITDWLEVGLDGTYNNNDYSGQAANFSSSIIYKSVPWGSPYRFEGMPANASSNTSTLLERYPTGQSIPNPLWGTDGTIDDIDQRDYYRLATYAIFKVPNVDGLTYRINFSIDSNVNTRDRFVYESYYVGEANSAPYEDRYSPEAYASHLSSANGYNNRTKSYSYVLDNIINYKKELGDHYIDFTAVATRDYDYYKQVSATGSDYALNGNTLLGVNGIHKATVQKIDLNVVEKSNIGYVGRLSYAFQDKYHLTATFRRDGSSVFGEDQKWGNFPSLGVAWTASEEDFISKFDKLTYLKVKASYGKNGNQGLSPYQTLASVTSGSDGKIRYEFGDAPSTILYGVRQDNLGSPTLGWETTTAFNGGFQSAWLNNRVFFDMDFYFSKTTDQIFKRNIPIMTGFSTIYSSLGQIDNKGIELSLRTINIDNKDFKWSSGLLFWQNRNKIAKLYGDDLDGDGVEDDDISNSYFIGKSIGAIYGYEFIGVAQEDDTEYLANVGGEAGDPMFKDISGPDGVPDGVITADYDRKILGYSGANFKMSLSNTVEYKNFSLYVMLTGIFGGGKDNYFVKSNPRATSFQNEYQYNEIDHDWWTPENKSETYLRANAYNSRYLGLQSRTFVKIQDVNLSYRLPKGMLSGIGVNALEVYASAKNLYTFSGWLDGGDPEKGIRPTDNVYPVATTYMMGLKVSF